MMHIKIIWIEKGVHMDETDGHVYGSSVTKTI